MIYVNTGSLKCFECGDIGHKKLECPHRAQANEEVAGPSGVTLPVVKVNSTTFQSQEESIAQNDESSDSVELRQNKEDKVVNVAEEREVLEHSAGIVVKKASESADCEVIRPTRPFENNECSNDVENREEDDALSELSDISEFGSQNLEETYSVQEINEFLDLTFGKTVKVEDFFPDIDKFIWSVVSMQKVVSFEALCKKKRFRLKKIIAKLRREKRALQK